MNVDPIRKNSYKAWCSDNKGVPVFLQPWWLDLDAGPENWDVLLFEKNGVIEACLPLVFTKRWGFRGAGMPAIAPYSGHYITPVITSNAEHQTEQVLASLYSKIPKIAYFYQELPPGVNHLLPLKWMGFSHVVRFTNIIPDISNPEAVFAQFEGRARGGIRKAEKLTELTKEHDADILFHVMEATYKKQGKKNFYHQEHLKRVVTASLEHKCGHLYVARSRQSGLVEASAFMVWDKTTCYDLIQGSMPEYLPSNATSLIIWTAIQEASANGIKSFDFTGGMMPNIHKFLRSFGAVQVPYFAISKEYSFPFLLLSKIKEVRDWVGGGW
jgi:hypothetical protein